MRSLVVFVAIFAVAVASSLKELPKNKRSVGYGVVVPSSPVLYNSQVYVEPAVRTVYSAPASAVYTLPSAVSSQSRVDVRSSPAVVAVQSAPVAPVVLAQPQAYSLYAGGSAVSQQSQVLVKSSPAVVTEQVVQPAVVSPTVIQAAPAVYGAAPVVGRSVYYTPVSTYAQQPIVSVQQPSYYAEQVVSPLLLKKKRSSQ